MVTCRLPRHGDVSANRIMLIFCRVAADVEILTLYNANKVKVHKRSINIYMNVQSKVDNTVVDRRRY